EKVRAATGCAPTRLALTQSDLVSNFSIAAGWPTSLTVRLSDDCGSPLQGGQVVLPYSNRDPAQTMSLSHPLQGIYSATLVPAHNGRHLPHHGPRPGRQSASSTPPAHGSCDAK